MSGQGDDKADRIVQGALAGGPADILDLLTPLRKQMPAILALHEGVVHAVLQRAVKQGTVLVAGRSARGLTLYRMAGRPEPGRARTASATEAPEASAHAAAALRDGVTVASGARSAADRGRIAADVAAHLEQLERAGHRHRFGSVRVARQFIERVSRGRPTVCLSASASDTARRLLLHEGPWIFGALLVFFVLKLFVVAVYKIPSTSMEPTLAVHDRVAVFLLGTGGVPDRWTVVTFERGGITYVKRLIGLPGEELAILNGDVYADGRLLVKPDPVRAALRSRVGAWDFRAGPPEGWRPAGDGGWTWKRGGFPAHPSGSRGNSYVMRDGYVVVEGERGAHGALTATLRRGPAGGIDEASVAWTLEVGVNGISVREERTAADGGTSAATLEAQAPPPPEGPTRLEISYVDGVLRAACAGWSWQTTRAAPDAAFGVDVGQRGMHTAVAQVRVDRDLHYAHMGTQGVPSAGGRAMNPHRIARNRVFVMGDNTTNSKDSRYRETGDIPVDDLIGPVSVRIWPPSRWGRVR